jgi:ribose transport system ATP-binding protein
MRFGMQGIRKAFGATVALDGVELSVAAGEICGLVGQNGAGKSTLMAILAGALAPDAGSMTIDGRPYAPPSPIEARRAGVAMIYQELSLAPHLTVMENILLGAEPMRYGLVDRARMRQMASAALAQLGHEDIPPDAAVGTLSVAAQQLVEIARALAVGCRVLVLDEPTSSLGGADVAHLFTLLRRLKAQGHAIVYISHFIEEVKAITDRFVVLRDGRNAGGGVSAEATHDAIVRLMVGAAPDDLFPRTPRQAGESIVEVAGLEPGSASFTLYRGEILGIAGLVGSGRTRLLRTLFGLETVKSGRIRIGVFGGAALAAGPRNRWRAGMGLLSEDRKSEGLALGLSIADNLTLTRLEPFGPYALVMPGRQKQASSEWISRMEIKCAGPSQAAGELSGGNQQKIALARLLHHDVDILILDEPTRGIDVGSKAQIYRLIDELVALRPGSGQASDEGRPLDQARDRPAKAVLMVSSYLPELLGLCDRIAVMRRGKLDAPRPAAGLTEHDLMMAATTGAAG